MKLHIDTDARTLTVERPDGTSDLPLYSRDSFELVSDLWVKIGWDQKYSYTFTWLGRPIIQLPEDMVRMQEVIVATTPDVIIETGVAHGGSLVFSATLCHAIGTGRVIGIDIEIRGRNRRAIEDHALSPLITLIEGDSAAPQILAQVKAALRPGERVLVILDSNHSVEHVTKELEAYAPLVTPGSYLVVTDGIMAAVADTPRGNRAWIDDGPLKAIATFLGTHAEFVQEQPAWMFNESGLGRNVTHWPSAYLRRL